MNRRFGTTLAPELEEPLPGTATAGRVNRQSTAYIRWAQQSLNKIMKLKLAEDGKSGPQTRSALRSFQQRSRLAVDGKLGANTEQALVRAGASPPPRVTGGGAAPPGARPAALPGREQTAAGTTLYAPIDLRIASGQARTARPITGIFIPSGYRPQAQVDIILYLHGYKVRPQLTINDYWDASKFGHFALREATAASRRNVILVAPTLGPKSETGLLTRPGGLDRYLGRVLDVLRTQGPQRTARIMPRLGQLVLACHSGGGYPMRRLALGSDSAATAIRECWGFDCTYNRGDDTLWAQWARKHPDRRLYIYYIPNSRTAPRARSLAAKKVPNAIVRKSRPRGGHNAMPLAHWRERLEGAPFLKGNAHPSVTAEALNQEVSMIIISDSVGSGGTNKSYDVTAVQNLLNKFIKAGKLAGIGSLVVDGKSGSRTVAAIRTFQRTYVGLRNPDGRVDPGGRTLQKLNGPVSQPIPSSGSAPAGAPAEPVRTRVPFAPVPRGTGYWPVRTKHSQARVVSYKTAPGKIIGRGGRRFMADRKGKRNGVTTPRYHAGVDLFARPGDPVIACEDGTIVQFKFFYKANSGQSTYKLLVQHPDVVVNYGEVTADSLRKAGLSVGSRVRGGQVIGTVSDTSMLHFETYQTGTTTTYRWWKDQSRPSRLLDPTKYLLYLQRAGL